MWKACAMKSAFALTVVMALVPAVPAAARVGPPPVCGAVQDALSEAGNWFRDERVDMDRETRLRWEGHLALLGELMKPCRVTLPRTGVTRDCEAIQARLANARKFLDANRQHLTGQAREKAHNRVRRLQMELAACLGRAAALAMPPEGPPCGEVERALAQARKMKEDGLPMPRRHLSHLQRAVDLCGIGEPDEPESFMKNFTE
ncbi:MAG: hypothetical protein JRI97_08785 [Deltaproteobacteria bacterium]|nr:hypothetical protein [Deltaproteobacteria bacterium]